MYEAPVSNVLVGLADVSAASTTTVPATTEDPFGGQTFIGDCL